MSSLKSLKVLLIEDLAQDAELIERAIRKGGYDLSCERADSLESVQAALKLANWDIVLSDFNIPGFGAKQALELLKKSGKSMPFIVVSGAIGEETAVELMKAGAEDYVMKSKLDRLLPAIERSLRTHHASILAEQAQSAREHLLAVVSHDLKNPLGGISLNLQVALKKLEEARKTSGEVKVDAIQSCLERAQKSSQRMLKLIQGILDQTNIQSGKLNLKKERCSVSVLMHELSDLFQPLAEKSGLTFETREEGEECQFPFDFERIFQALGNLVSNAIKFTPAGGKITVWYESSPQQVSFFVNDTGKGIPQDQQTLIFKRFWQANHTSGQGLGLGLSICRGIIENHGGTVQVFSKEDEGTTFQVILPRGEAIKEPLPTVRSERILVVDDDESLAEALTETLRDRGFQVHWSTSGEKALELLDEPSSRFALAIVDYRLPQMNGGEFATRLRAQKNRNANIPIMLCSAESNLDELAKVLPIQATLAKPADLEQFLDLTEKTLRNRTLPGISAKSITTYLIRRVEDLHSCRNALEVSDFETIRAIAHRIKGSASTFGFPDLSEIASRLELAVSKAEPASIRQSVSHLENWISERVPADSP